MNKSIAIIELESHPDILQKLFELLSSCTLYKITIYTLPWIYNLLETTTLHSHITFTLKPDQQSISTFLSTYHDEISQHDRVLITSLSRSWHTYLKIIEANRTSIIAHNLHHFFELKEHRTTWLQGSTKQNAKRVINVISQRGDQAKCITAAHSIITLLSMLTKRAKKVRPELNISTLELYYPLSRLVSRDRVPIIIIPGGANAENRDYTYLLRWLKNTDREVHLVFLGSSTTLSDRRIINKMEQFGHIQCTSFATFMSSSTYRSWYNRAYVAISPLKQEVTFDGYIEQYGLSKISGAISDAIRFSCPMLVPDFYPVDTLIKPHPIIGYAHYEDFVQKLDDQLNASSASYSTPYSADNAKKELLSVLRLV